MNRMLKFTVVLFCVFVQFALDFRAQQAKNEKVNVFYFMSWANSRSGEVSIENGPEYRFSVDFDNAGRFAFDNYVIVNYFLVPNWVSMGVGTGFFRSFNPNLNLLPIIADLRGYIFQDEKALFLYMQYGYSFGMIQQIDTGGVMGVGIGGNLYCLAKLLI